ncbi:hypothetical protein PSPO01_11396 [Paraphaeosphaeria sporulosa]
MRVACSSYCTSSSSVLLLGPLKQRAEVYGVQPSCLVLWALDQSER